MPDHFDLDRDICYRALLARDARFDGRFYTAVTSTGIYCRPICPARPPKIENCVFLPSAGAAHQMGFRPCLRCRPEMTPGIAGWLGTANTVSRALQLISEGAMNEAGVDDLADRLGITARHLRRLFDKHVGATPVSVAQAQRILFAKRLLTESALSMTDVALAAGFGSLRRFNHTMRETYGRTPTQLRCAAPHAAASSNIALKLPFTPPYDWPSMIRFLAARAIPGVEAVERDCYWRTFAIERAQGAVHVRPMIYESHLLATIWISDIGLLATVVTRLRRLFDLNSDILTVDADLSAHPVLAHSVRERPGVRVPGAWDEFELAVRAILGQQITVRAATAFAGRIASEFGRPLKITDGDFVAPVDRVFPVPADLSFSQLTRIGLTRARAETLRNLAAGVVDNPRLLRAAATLEHTVAKLEALPGVGPWTAQYIAMRALGEPNAFPASDLGLRRAMATDDGLPSATQLEKIAETWQPWRAYAAMRLWSQEPDSREKNAKSHRVRKRQDGPVRQPHGDAPQH